MSSKSISRFRTLKTFHHEIQPVVMCPINCTQLNKKCVPLLLMVCPWQSKAILYVRSFHYTHQAGASSSRQVCAILMDAVCDECMKSLALSAASWHKALASLQRVLRSLAVLEPPSPSLIHRPSHLARPVIKESDCCGKGSEVFRPTQCACH